MKRPDARRAEAEVAARSDGGVLDRAVAWYNLAARVVAELPTAWKVKLP